MGFEVTRKRPEVDAPFAAPSPAAPRSTILDAMSGSRDGSKPYHHGDLRKALLDATLALIDEHGPQGFTLRAAARAAGVTPGATYHHFRDKEDLVAAVAEDSFAMLQRALTEAADGPAATPRERSCNVGVAYVLFAVKHPTRFRVMLGYGVLAKDTAASMNVEALQTYRFVREILVEGLAHDSAEHVSDAEVLGWWAVVHGLAFLSVDGHLGRVARSEKRIAQVVRDVIDALDRRTHESSAVRRKDAR